MVTIRYLVISDVACDLPRKAKNELCTVIIVCPCT